MCIMALTVNTNMAAMSAANSLNSTQGSLADTLGRVSSGMRITKAADDAAKSWRDAMNAPIVPIPGS